MPRQLIFLVFIFTCILFGLNFIAERFGLYDNTAWFDILSHTTGGMVVAGIFIYLAMVRGAMPQSMSVFFFVFFVGVVWEFYELYTGFTHTTDLGYYLNTVRDLFFDMAGAYIMYLLVNKKIYARK